MSPFNEDASVAHRYGLDMLNPTTFMLCKSHSLCLGQDPSPCPAPGLIQVAAGGLETSAYWYVSAVGLYCQWLLWLYASFLSESFCFLHVRWITHQNSQWLFLASVWLVSARQDDMSPSGNTFAGKILIRKFDRWIYTFVVGNLSLPVAVLNNLPQWLASLCWSS